MANRMFLAVLGLVLVTSAAQAQSPQPAEPNCVAASVKRLDAPPANAAALRDLAKRHPRNRNKFGPPPSQQDFPGSVWDMNNEFWYQGDNGDVLLYVNTDDGYMYRWRFRTTAGKVRLLDHELRGCPDGDRPA